MIKLCDNTELDCLHSVEALKIACHKAAYFEDTLVWQQSGGRAVVGMLDSNMIIYDRNADYQELSEFIKVISPQSVFSSAKTLERLGLSGFERACVYVKKRDSFCEAQSDRLSSKEIYDLLNVPQLSLPDYPHFAVDFCHRLNHGQAHYFAIKDKCAAVTFNTQSSCIVNGIVSREKGKGSLALSGVLSLNKGKPAFCVCRKEVGGFYQKNGFEYFYDVGYWRKSS